MKLNYFNFKKMGDSYLITNDFGNYAFIDQNNFTNLVKQTPFSDKDLEEELIDKCFIYDDSDLDYSGNVSGGLLRNKGYLAQATSLHIFVVTTSCNLGCIYCQANNGSYYTNRYMDEGTAQRAVDIALQSPEEYLDFEFQGGEPLKNFPIIKYIVSYTESHKGIHKIHYSLVSNLTMLTDEVMDFILENNISISTSLDGNEIVHNYNRHYSNGIGSFDQVKHALEMLNKKGIPTGAIETTTKFSLKYPEQIVDAYRKLGFHSIFIRPLTPLGRAYKSWDLIGYTADEFLTFYKKAFFEILQLNESGYEMREDHAAILLKRIFGGYVNYMELRSPCGGGTGQIAYYSDGKIFTCDEGRMLYEMGDDSFCLGDTENSKYRDLIENRVCKTVCSASILESLPSCTDCVYQCYCGVCPVVNYAHCNDVIEKSPNGYKCLVYKGILDFLFGLIKKNDSSTLKILRHWGDAE